MSDVKANSKDESNKSFPNSTDPINTFDFQSHWNSAYTRSPQNKLGWFETDLKPSFELIDLCDIDKDARILVVGSGSTTLVDALIDKGYNSIIASDISDIALTKLSERIEQKDSIEFIVDDLTAPDKLKEIAKVGLWIDRAVLHFLVDEKEQAEYFNLLKSKVKSGGYVILAEFSIEGAKKCSGLPVLNYSEEMFKERLGDDFELIKEFDFSYTMPSGDLRPYIYTLYKRK